MGLFDGLLGPAKSVAETLSGSCDATWPRGQTPPRSNGLFDVPTLPEALFGRDEEEK